jgi:hypothetical protein
MAEDSDFLSPQEMAEWLDGEIKNTMRAADLRARDAAALATAYTSGKIKPEEAEQRLYQFSKRWGDALPGVSASENLTDGEILKRIDETRLRQLKRWSTRSDPSF